MNKLPRITFGMIVLNGEPFIRYNLRALYPFAHQIIIVEGATPTAKSIAAADGHSTDGTLSTIDEFIENEDKENKVTLVTAEDNGYPSGYWPGEKNEQSRAYAERATGDYLWQIDVDEFYLENDMQAVLKMLENNPGISAVSFKMKTFWGGFDHVTDGWHLQEGAEVFHRLFRWRPGYQYVTHRPPTVCDSSGLNLRKIRWLNWQPLYKKGIQLYHYSLVFPKQVIEKCQYYAAGPWGKYSSGIIRWGNENFLSFIDRPFQIHNMHTYPSWIERYRGQHPKQITSLIRDIAQGTINIDCRNNTDVDRLLHSPSYLTLRAILQILSKIRQPKKLTFRFLYKRLFNISYNYERNRLTLS